MSEMSGQSATGGYRPAGWYYAQGDPPGTQRYWDGSSWQGAPQPVNPSGQYAATESSAVQDTVDYSDHRASQATHATAAAGATASTEPATPATEPGVASVDDWGAPASEMRTPVGSSDPPGVGGFLSTLFDIKFTSFITGRAISVVYVLVLIVVAVMTLFFIVGGLAGGGPTALVALILGPLVGLFYLVFIRMTLEFFVNQFRQTELLEAIAEKLDRDAD